jgi:hypothetical protein
MIVKRIDKKSGDKKNAGAGLVAVARYVLRETGSPGSWRRQAEYAVDIANRGKDGPKVDWVSVTNCGAVSEPGRVIQLMEATRQQNARIRGGAKMENGYHLVFSFTPGEKPSREVMAKIENVLIAAVGLGDYQRMSAAHQDKEHYHVHVVVNLIHPTTFLKAEPYYDKLRLQEKCAELEVEHGLTRTNHGDLEPVFKVEVKDRAEADLMQAAEVGQGWQDFHKAAAVHGLRVRKLGGGITLARADESRLRLKASAVNRGLSLAKLSARFGEFEEASAEVLSAMRPWDKSATRPAQPPKPRKERESAGAEGGLFARFQMDRSQARAARLAALQTAKKEHHRARAALVAYHRDRIGRAWEGVTSTEARRAEASRRKAERDRDRTERGEEVLRHTAALNRANPVPTWAEWLEAKAAEGEAEAVAALRRRGQLAGVGSPGDAEHQPHPMRGHIEPHKRKDGTLAYSLSDGGRVADRGSVVELERVSDGASALALRIAAERYGISKPMAVTGPDNFRRSLADMAGRAGATVYFEDPELEARRVRAGGITLAKLNHLAEGRAAREAFRAKEVMAQFLPDRGPTRDQGRGRD